MRYLLFLFVFTSNLGFSQVNRDSMQLDVANYIIPCSVSPIPKDSFISIVKNVRVINKDPYDDILTSGIVPYFNDEDYRIEDYQIYQKDLLYNIISQTEYSYEELLNGFNMTETILSNYSPSYTIVDYAIDNTFDALIISVIYNAENQIQYMYTSGYLFDYGKFNNNNINDSFNKNIDSDQLAKIDGEVVEFNAPYESINVSVDGEIYNFIIGNETKFTSDKSGKIPFRYYCIGCEIEISYKIQDKKRFVKKIKLNSDYTPGKEKINGILEYYDEDLAYIDGRKVLMDNSTRIECSGKIECGCTKGMTYLGFDELGIGDFIKVTGDSNESGAILANKILVCENELTLEDQLVRDQISLSVNTDGIELEQAPYGITVPANSLFQGNIRMGIIEYKLLNNILLQGYVNVVGNKVVPNYAKSQKYREKHDVFFRFYVIDDPIPNAYAFPNGMVFIHTGLLELIENEAQLAVVLGHEVAHVTYEHASERMKLNAYVDSDLIVSSTRRLLGRFLESRSDTLLESISDISMVTKPSDLSNLYSQSNESQADRVGLYYAFNSGYDIREALNFWKKMGALTNESNFQYELESNALSIINSNGVNIKRTVSGDLTQDKTQRVVDNFLNTVYTSHPIVESRIREMSDLINSIYFYENLDLRKGADIYRLKTRGLKINEVVAINIDHKPWTFEDIGVQYDLLHYEKNGSNITFNYIVTATQKDAILRMDNLSILLYDDNGLEVNASTLKIGNKSGANIKYELIQGIQTHLTINFKDVPENTKKISLLKVPFEYHGGSSVFQLRDLDLK